MGSFQTIVTHGVSVVRSVALNSCVAVDAVATCDGWAEEKHVIALADRDAEFAAGAGLESTLGNGNDPIGERSAMPQLQHDDRPTV